MDLSQQLGNARRRIVEVRCNSRIGRKEHVPGFNGYGATWWPIMPGWILGPPCPDQRLQSSPRSRQWSAFQLLKVCGLPSVLPR